MHHGTFKQADYFIKPSIFENFARLRYRKPQTRAFVTDPVDWKYSSARNFQDDHSVMQIDEIGVLR